MTAATKTGFERFEEPFRLIEDPAGVDAGDGVGTVLDGAMAG